MFRSVFFFTTNEAHHKPCLQFHQTVRIKALKVHSCEPSKGPFVVKILVNRPSISFEDVQEIQESELAQVVRLSSEDISAGKQIPLRFVRFQSVSSVHVSIPVERERDIVDYGGLSFL